MKREIAGKLMLLVAAIVVASGLKRGEKL